MTLWQTLITIEQLLSNQTTQFVLMNQLCNTTVLVHDGSILAFSIVLSLIGSLKRDVRSRTQQMRTVM